MLLGAWQASAAQPPVQLWDEAYVRVRPGATVQARFHLSVAPGFSVVAQDVGPSAGLRPLRLSVPAVAGLRFGAPLYPPASLTLTVPGASEIPAHEGTLAVSLPITVPASADRPPTLIRGTLEYQACSAAGCLPPATLPVRIELELRPSAPAQ